MDINSINFGSLLYDKLLSEKTVTRPLKSGLHTIAEDYYSTSSNQMYMPTHTAKPTSVSATKPISTYAPMPISTSATQPISTSATLPVSGSTIKTNCKNLTTGAPLYDNNTICFYERSDPYYEFTNFYSAPITINGKTYPTTEHYFQEQKFIPAYPNIANMIISAPSPRNAFDIARTNKSLVNPNWHKGLKDKVMLDALQAKFTQHNVLKQLLLGTGDKTLVEHTKNDNYWGDNGDGSGQNKLGKSLMKVRDMLNKGTLVGGKNQLDNIYYDKYIKYKHKYLSLKDNQ